MPPVMKSIQQKHVTDHRATYCYKPQRAILIIALQKISRFVFNGVPSKRFSFIELHFYYTINMAIFQVLLVKKALCCLLCFSHTYILLLQKTAFFRLAPFYQLQKSVLLERSRKHNFKSKICFSLLDHVSFFLFDTPKLRTSTPFSEQSTSFLASDTPKQKKNHPKSERLRFRFSFYQFLRCNTYRVFITDLTGLVWTLDVFCLKYCFCYCRAGSPHGFFFRVKR